MAKDDEDHRRILETENIYTIIRGNTFSLNRAEIGGAVYAVNDNDFGYNSTKVFNIKDCFRFMITNSQITKPKLMEEQSIWLVPLSILR